MLLRRTKTIFNKYKYIDKEMEELISSITILIDTREKVNSHITDYFDRKGISYKKKALGYGDYSFMIPANEKLSIPRDLYFNTTCVIERKASLEEISGNLTKERDRFEKELCLAPKTKVLLIENASYEDIAKGNYDTKYNDIKILADNRSLIYINQKLLLWRYPPEIFELFDKVYILTYLFEASILKNYFNLYKIDYEQKSISENDGQYELTNYYIPDTSVFLDKINIYDGKLNDNIYQKINGLSVTWFKARINQDGIKQIKKNLYNYFSNIVNAKSDNIMWTTFKDYKAKLKGKGYSSQFVSYNCRSTNKYADTYNLAYCVNVYLHPGITQFFLQRGISINEDLYGLSEMIQWIWRSRIRKGESINIYIPSMRMRNLLIDWMNMNLQYQHKKVS